MRAEKYYYSFPDYCKEKFGRKLYRIALSLGTTCPNRDGKIGRGGCIFCSSAGSGDFALKYQGEKLNLKDLTYLGKTSGVNGDYIAYFQSFTNTYGDPKRLEYLFDSAMKDEAFAGISIATRPDCLGTDVLEIFKRLKNKYPKKFIWVELGLQTIHENSAEFIRRGYRLGVFDQAVDNLHELGIEVISHVIIGLPGENEEDLYKTIEHLNKLKVDGVKLQLLHYIKGTDLGEMYQAQNRKQGQEPGQYKGKNQGIGEALYLHALAKDEYLKLLTGAIGRLDKNIVIHRLTGDGDRESLIEPKWSLDKKNLLNSIRQELKKSGIYQGNLKTTTQ